MTKLVLGFLMTIASAANGFAGSLTIRDLKLNGNNQLEITLDGPPPKNSLEIDYVRDVVQFSLQNATIYPAKILHSDASTQAFSKVFAYQYAPNLVRVRFSVDGKADQFQGKVKWELNGKLLTVSFPAGVTAGKIAMVSKESAKKEAVKKEAVKKEEKPADHEKSLLAKVLGRSEPVKVEKIEDALVKAGSKSDREQASEDKSDEKLDQNSESSESKSERAIARAEAKQSHHLTGGGSTKSEGQALGGAKAGPSALRSFFAMLLVVGGLGLVLVYVKKKKNGIQAKKVGDSWFSGLLSNSKKQKSLIEVVGVHALGPKQSITVVRIRGQQLVLGVTEGNVQLITQLDSDEDFDLLDDPKVADSLGKIFGANPSIQAKRQETQTRISTPVRSAPPSSPDLGASFNALLKNSSGAGAMVARNAYQAQGNLSPQVAARSVSTSDVGSSSTVRDQIKQRLQGMRN